MKSDGFDSAGKTEDVEFDCINGRQMGQGRGQKLRFSVPGTEER